MKRFLRLFSAFKGDIATLIFAILNPKTPRKIRIGMILTVLYLISPIDFIPDTLPIVGIMDDAILIPTVVMILTNMLPASLKSDIEVTAWRYEKYVPIIMGFAGLMVVSWIVLVFYGVYRLIFT